DQPAGEAFVELLSSKGVVLTLKALVLSPLVGLVGGFLLMGMLLWMVRRIRPAQVNRRFRLLQLVSASFMAFAHGSNDAQKAMGIIAMALASYAAAVDPGATPPGDVHVPWWVFLACATVMVAGAMSGGWRLMK